MSLKKVFIIGEIGINHNGSLKKAKELILLAKKVGFDAVKFQKRTPEITTPKSKANLERETPWGKISYLKYKKKIEFGKKEFDEINKFCKKIQIDWFQVHGILRAIIFFIDTNLNIIRLHRQC